MCKHIQGWCLVLLDKILIRKHFSFYSLNNIGSTRMLGFWMQSHDEPSQLQTISFLPFYADSLVLSLDL